MKKILPLMVFVFLLSIPFAGGDLLYTDAEKFREHNPDVGKYDFVKDYLNSLSYLKTNEKRDREVTVKSSGALEKIENVKALIDNLIMDNANLRVARNYLKKYKRSPNGLILKVTDLFIKVSDEQIEFNNQERGLFESLHQFLESDDFKNFNKDKFLEDQKYLSDVKRESLKGLLEASLLVNKILISENPDEFGEYVNLGITKKERQKLLKKINEFEGGDYQGDLREGQTFLQGSVSVIREILEDKSWAALDG